MKVYLDTDEAPIPLSAYYVREERWNGFVVPVVTAAAFADFLDRQQRNDPDGEWGRLREVRDLTYGLTYLELERSDGDEAEEFPPVGRTADGERLYVIQGWTFVGEDDAIQPPSYLQGETD